MAPDDRLLRARTALAVLGLAALTWIGGAAASASSSAPLADRRSAGWVAGAGDAVQAPVGAHGLARGAPGASPGPGGPGRVRRTSAMELHSRVALSAERVAGAETRLLGTDSDDALARAGRDAWHTTTAPPFRFVRRPTRRAAGGPRHPGTRLVVPTHETKGMRT